MNTTPNFPFNPIRENIIMIPLQEADQIGGIFIPESAKRALNQGQVIKIGPDVSYCDVGDIILFPLHQETRIQFEREWFYILDQNQILCKLAKPTEKIPEKVIIYSLEYLDDKYWTQCGTFLTEKAAWDSIGKDKEGYRVIPRANKPLPDNESILDKFGAKDDIN